MKAHYAGRGSRGEDVFHETGGNRCLHAVPLKSGETVRLGEVAATVVPTEDGQFEIETMDGSPFPTSGPAQVATKSYRDGWDRVFGDKPSGPAN